MIRLIGAAEREGVMKVDVKVKTPLQYPRAASSVPCLCASSLIRNPLFLGHTERGVTRCQRRMQDDGDRFPLAIIIIILFSATIALLLPAPT